MQVQQHITPGPNPPGDAGALAPQATATLGGVITLGSTKLTLTPGLSTTVGPKTDATSIGITVDGTGQTVITLSSSGRAITATVSDTLAVITLPKTGFEASITDVARPASFTGPDTRGAAVSTSRKKGAANKSGELHGWTGAMLGILGLGVVL